MNKIKTIRVEALDIFRAITMFLMLFVNEIPGLKNIPHWLLHAATNEDMLGFSDTIFPAFLFAMGMAIPYAIQNRLKKGDTTIKIGGHIFWRTLALLIMGLFTVNIGQLDPVETGMTSSAFMLLMALAFFLIWSVYPKTDDWKDNLFIAMKIAGVIILVYLFVIFEGKNGEDFAPRWWGILGLIGWTYVLSASIYLITRENLLYNSIALIILITLSLLSASGTFKGWPLIDQIPSQATLYAFGMAGVWAGTFMRKYANKEEPKRFFIVMAAIGVVSLIIAIITHQFWIISKIQATPTWFFYCCAIFFPLFAFVFRLTDIKGKSNWFHIIKPAGTVTLTCYIIPYAWYSLQTIIGFNYPAWMMTGIAGIIKSLLFSLAIIGIAWLLMKAKIRLKI
ncbi:DUF5009 domain-containing protein [Dysgonomonas reticulitermitis]